MYHFDQVTHRIIVSPYIGEWIEICYWIYQIISTIVSPYIGEWIEMLEAER